MTAAAAAGTGLLGSSLTGQVPSDKKRFLKSVQYGMLPKTLSDPEKFQLAHKCGFDGLEGRPDKDFQAARERAKIARDAGCPFHGLVFGWWPPFTDTTPSVVQKSIDAMKNALLCAREMKAETVLLVPTRVTDNFSYADAYKRSQEYVHRLIPAAQETGVVIAVENVWNKFLLSPLEFARYLDELDSKYIRAYFDVGNVIIYGFAQHWIRTLGKRIIRIHLKDFKREGYKWTNLGEGDVNWPEVRKALDEIGYNGWITTELRGGDEAYLTELSQRIDRLLSLKA
jgi:hexulose-6-phosphate isomerase